MTVTVGCEDIIKLYIQKFLSIRRGPIFSDRNSIVIVIKSSKKRSNFKVTMVLWYLWNSCREMMSSKNIFQVMCKYSFRPCPVNNQVSNDNSSESFVECLYSDWAKNRKVSVSEYWIIRKSNFKLCTVMFLLSNIF